MRRLAILLFSTLCMTLTGHAQTYTQHIQQRQGGKGTVTVTQSKEIDDLVNGTVNSTAPSSASSAARQSSPAARPSSSSATVKKPSQTPAKAESRQSTPKEKEMEAVREEERRKSEKAAEERRSEERRRAEAEKAEKAQESESEMDIPTVDMRKKVMRNARKVTGFRVQAFAGGNTRTDKQKAQQAGENIKMHYPDQPIYVHFYSPRWICRVGNYRTYAEAERMLKAVKALGYKGATIVKGKITVFE